MSAVEFDGRPFGHSWSIRRPGLAYDTPADPVEDHRLIECPCKAERVVGQACWQCGLAPKRGEK